MLDRRIGSSHSYVTNERGFGGHCLPKDTKAIKHSALYHGVDLSILKEILKYNESLKDDTDENKKN